MEALGDYSERVAVEAAEALRPAQAERPVGGEQPAEIERVAAQVVR